MSTNKLNLVNRVRVRGVSRGLSFPRSWSLLLLVVVLLGATAPGSLADWFYWSGFDPVHASREHEDLPVDVFFVEYQFSASLELFRVIEGNEVAGINIGSWIGASDSYAVLESYGWGVPAVPPPGFLGEWPVVSGFSTDAMIVVPEAGTLGMVIVGFCGLWLLRKQSFVLAAVFVSLTGGAYAWELSTTGSLPGSFVLPSPVRELYTSGALTYERYVEGGRYYWRFFEGGVAFAYMGDVDNNGSFGSGDSSASPTEAAVSSWAAGFGLTDPFGSSSGSGSGGSSLSTNDFAETVSDAGVLGQVGDSLIKKVGLAAIGILLFGMAWAWFKRRTGS